MAPLSSSSILDLKMCFLKRKSWKKKKHLWNQSTFQTVLNVFEFFARAVFCSRYKSAQIFKVLKHNTWLNTTTRVAVALKN
jgi:hypothetical protein